MTSSDTNNKMRDCNIAEMPDNKMSMASSISTVNNILGVSNKFEMNTSEELLTNSFSDSESGLATQYKDNPSKILFVSILRKHKKLEVA